MHRRTTLLALSAALLALTACAQQVGDIDRTQPNGLEKSFFDDEWYYQRTVVDVPSGNGFTFVGSSDFSGLSKITWDVQESFLFARRSIELIEGGDDLAQTGEDYEGEVIAAFRITSHFDVQRQYNSSTGEETNVIEENSRDRPWYDREYMRVDWSQNLVHNYQFDFETQSVESIPYYVQDLEDGSVHPDAPLFADDESYFDVTSKLFATADSVYIEGWGMAPSCWLWGHEFDECGAGEYAIRHSFLRIDAGRQYVPEPYKGAETSLFGFFTADRMTYDPLEGIREQHKRRFITRHNLWENWYDASTCRTLEEGEEPVEGEVRLIDEACAEIPVPERTLRPIVYHVNDAMPDDLRPIVTEVGDQWNRVFVDVVTALGYPLEEGERVFVACPNNPIAEDDHPACGAAGMSPRLGDIRYSFMAYVPKYMQYGLLGLGPSNNDPETGEIISGMGYLYHHNNLAAYDTMRMIELLGEPEGSPALAEFIDGVDLSEWADEVNGRREAAPRTFGLEDAGHMAHSIANGWMSQAWEGRRREITEADGAYIDEHGFDAWAEPHLEHMYREGLLNGEYHAADGRLRQLEGTYIEELLLTDEMLATAGRMPGEPITEAHRDRASVVRGGFAQDALQRQQLRERYAAANNMYLPEMADDALMGFARELKDRSSEEIYAVVRDRLYTAVFAHEVGHSLGLMHNFGGSDDVVNYFDEYWEIRDDGRVGPRSVDPITDAEIDASIYNYAYSSVMDYNSRLTIDGAGIGKYDRASILYGYAGMVEVFRDSGGMPPADLAAWHSNDGNVITGGGDFGLRTIHYTDYYNRMGSLLYEDDNRMLVSVDDFADGFDRITIDGVTHDRVPYIYCSHSSSDLSDHCLTRDAGADSMERMSNMLDDLNTWYVRRNFPRGRIGVNTFNYVSRYYGRVYHRLKYWNNLYGLYAALLSQFLSPSDLERFLTDSESGFGAQTWAVQNAFNHLVQTLLMPNIGQYDAPRAQSDGARLATESLGFFGLHNLDVSDARYYATNWSFGSGDGRECGYMWYECLHHIGFYLDKIMAIEALTDSSTYFVARSTPEDIREWEVSYYNTFPDQIARLSQAIMSQDWETVGPYMEGGELHFPNYGGDLSDEHATPIDPFATFTIQLYWQVLGQARFPNNYDRSFIQESRIFEVGSGRQIDLDEDRLTTFTDPDSGITYGAIHYTDRETAGDLMLQRARCLDAVGNGEGDPEDECPAFADGLPSRMPNPATARFELDNYVELLEILADLSTVMDYGDPYNP